MISGLIETDVLFVLGLPSIRLSSLVSFLLPSAQQGFSVSNGGLWALYYIFTSPGFDEQHDWL